MKRRDFVGIGISGIGALAFAEKCWPQADKKITIRGEGFPKEPLAIVSPAVPAGADSKFREKAQQVLDGLEFDAEFSGYFEVLANREKFNEISAKDRETNTINYPEWRNTGAQLVIKTEFEPAPDGYVFQYRIYHVGKGEYFGGRKVEPKNDALLRRAIHYASDDLVKRACEKTGVAQTRIAFVHREGRIKELYLMDYDGHPDSIKQITKDKNLSLFPSWHPSGQGLAFTSYLKQNPDLHFMDFSKSIRYPLSVSPGVNYGASFNPKDGTKMILTLSRDGNPEIYEVDLDTKKLKRLTKERSVDCSPVYSPDGTRIAFTSGRSSRPHIYIMNSDGTNQRQLTKGRYEDSATWCLDGKSIAYAQKKQSGEEFCICRTSIDGGGTIVLTGPNEHCECPEFSPDGRHLIFTSNRDGNSQIYVLNNMDDPQSRKVRRLTYLPGECSSPAWSPV